MAAVTKHHKFGVKQQEFILTRFWRLEDHIKELAGPHFSIGSRGEFFLAPSSFGGCRHSLACGHLTLISFSVLEDSVSASTFTSHSLCV